MATISTSYVEAFNLATLTHCTRFARLTTAHSQKEESDAHGVVLQVFAYNDIRVQTTLTKDAGRKTTPAMASGLADRPWTVEDLLTLMDPKAVTVEWTQGPP